MLGDARWIASVTASALHLAECLISGKVSADRQPAAALASEARALEADLAAINLPAERFFQHALPMSVRFNALPKLSEVALNKALGRRQPDDAAQRIARRMTALVNAFREAVPGVVEELELRSGPLREQWEARGPGLLATLRLLTERDVVVETAEVILVHPVLGGGGRAHPLYNSLHFEALLASPWPSLPEIVRLGWLWGQLNLDLPKYHEALCDRLADVGPPALLPPLLAAAQQVELARFDRATISEAIAAWQLPPADADVLHDWWETYAASNPPWPVALSALDRMLHSDPL